VIEIKHLSRTIIHTGPKIETADYKTLNASFQIPVASKKSIRSCLLKTKIQEQLLQFTKPSKSHIYLKYLPAGGR